MIKHSPRWDALVFGLLFAAACAYWWLHDLDLITVRNANVWAAGLLIAAGCLGTLLTLRPTRTRNRTNNREGHHEETDA
jgi:hypothetical protein